MFRNINAYYLFKYLNDKEMITDEIVHQAQNRQLVEQIERSSSSSDNPARGIRLGDIFGCYYAEIPYKS